MSSPVIARLHESSPSSPRQSTGLSTGLSARLANLDASSNTEVTKPSACEPAKPAVTQPDRHRHRLLRNVGVGDDYIFNRPKKDFAFPLIKASREKVQAFVGKLRDLHITYDGTERDCRKFASLIDRLYGYQTRRIEAEAHTGLLVKAIDFVDGNKENNVFVNGEARNDLDFCSNHAYNFYEDEILDATYGIYCPVGQFENYWCRFSWDEDGFNPDSAPELKRILGVSLYQTRIGATITLLPPKLEIVLDKWSTSNTCEIAECQKSLGWWNGHHHCRACGKAICSAHTKLISRAKIATPMFKDQGECDGTGNLKICTRCSGNLAGDGV